MTAGAAIDVRFATSPDDREAVYRFRYRIYVEEMGRYASIADHQGKRLVEDDDASSHLLTAWQGDDLVGTARLIWGGDAPFTARQIEQYDLAGFRNAVPDDQMIIGERFMIEPSLRGSDLLYCIFCAYMNFANDHRIQLAFGDCEPHLLNVYQGLGYRAYTRNNVNSPQTGYLIPLVLVTEDIAYLERIGSPLAAVLSNFAGDARTPANIEDLLSAGKAVLSQRLVEPASYWSNVRQRLDHLKDGRSHLFDGMTPDQIQHCLGKSNVFTCRPGDRVIKKDNVAQNMFVVLKGIVEVRDGDDVLAVLPAGEMFGEIAFFLGLPRTRDVYAATDDVEILSLSDSNLKELIESHSETAAILLKNIAKLLCHRIATSG
ncbi:MAG: cyclic nucleotide-binding domain-containing protein [Hyphomicrobiales bacterium]|nr:cyclic nucleotide-binding domain-containing protein [Hyphomicrobiales bacterium]